MLPKIVPESPFAHAAILNTVRMDAIGTDRIKSFLVSFLSWWMVALHQLCAAAVNLVID